jgi:flagellar biosynthesis regulator FlaF
LYILRVLSDDTTTSFRAALREHCADVAGSREKVRVAVVGAAKEARDDGMSAEQFVIWVKRIWDEIMDEGRLSQTADPGRTRDVVISSAIKAYYVQ